MIIRAGFRYGVSGDHIDEIARQRLVSGLCVAELASAPACTETMTTRRRPSTRQHDPPPASSGLVDFIQKRGSTSPFGPREAGQASCAPAPDAILAILSCRPFSKSSRFA